MRFIFTSANVVAIILIGMIIYGCSSAEKTVLVKSRAGLNAKDYDERYKLDSFKVVKVIDERASQDEFIGIADRSGANLMLQEPLSDYLLPRFNLAIARDTSIKKYTPVTVRVRDFYYGPSGPFYNKGVFFKYDLAFEYPYAGGTKTFVMVDSANRISHGMLASPQNLDPGQEITTGIRRVARLFVLNTQEKISIADNQKVSWDSTSPKVQSFDSLNWATIVRQQYRYGLEYKHRIGIKSRRNVSAGIYKSIRYCNNYDIGLGLEASYAEVKYGKGLGSLYTVGLSTTYGDLFTENIDWLRYLIAFQSNGGSERFGLRRKEIYGGRLEGTIGVDILKYISVDLGAFLQGHLGAHLLPYDAGMTITVGLTSGF